MGKTSRWFRNLLGIGGGNTHTSKKPTNPPPTSSTTTNPEKKRWNFVRSFRDTNNNNREREKAARSMRGLFREDVSVYNIDGMDPSKHAIAVAAATAAVAEAAVTAANAAAVVVKLTSGGAGGGVGSTAAAYVSAKNKRATDYWAAVKIQSTFRGYLAKKALWALKGLVKLQALVRGHIVRKKTADTMRAMQALVRVQTRARSRATSGSELMIEARRRNYKPSMSHPGPPTPEKNERTKRSNSTRHTRFSNLRKTSLKQNSCDNFDFGEAHLGWHYVERRMEDHREPLMRRNPTDDEKREKILEIDPGKPHIKSTGRKGLHSSYNAIPLDRNALSLTTIDSPSRDSTTAQRSNSSVSSGEVQSAKPRKFHHDIDDDVFSTAEESPLFYSSNSRPGSARGGPFTPTSEYSHYSGYSDHPNYMSNTESSKAKVQLRSQSAPRQRLEFEKSSSYKRSSGYSGQRLSTLRANFTSKAYPGSGRLDRLGLPDRNEMAGFDGLNRTRY